MVEGGIVIQHIKLYFALTFFLFISCQPLQKSAVDEGENSIISEELLSYYTSFMNKYNSVREKDAFIYFSDPHLLGSNSSDFLSIEKNLVASFESMRSLNNVLPIDFCLCGGDWLNNRDTQDAAKQKLLYTDSLMKEWFPPYYKMLGNHDTNYQGIVSANDSTRGDLSYDFIDNLYFRETGKAYYTFKSANTLFIILDTGIDWQTSLDNYRREQVEWLSQLLYNNHEEHIVVGMHIFFNEYSKKVIRTPMSIEVMELCKAFNKKTIYKSATLDIDYAHSEGTIHFIISGHNHIDNVYYENGIPCVCITCLITEQKPSYDICLIDYNNGYLETTRIGHGDNRKIPLYGYISMPQ